MAFRMTNGRLPFPPHHIKPYLNSLSQLRREREMHYFHFTSFLKQLIRHGFRCGNTSKLSFVTTFLESRFSQLSPSIITLQSLPCEEYLVLKIVFLCQSHFKGFNFNMERLTTKFGRSWSSYVTSSSVNSSIPPLP